MSLALRRCRRSWPGTTVALASLGADEEPRVSKVEARLAGWGTPIAICADTHAVTADAPSMTKNSGLRR
ncbi:MAG TPA: hypothetical protein VMS00_10065 [Acidimicrobiales bacterium]|nr:hypothetical protein [Acidimicrobiales bacterium]